MNVGCLGLITFGVGCLCILMDYGSPRPNNNDVSVSLGFLYACVVR